MANPVTIKSTTGGASSVSNVSAALNGARLLYAQDIFFPAPNPYKWNMAKWIYLRGGSYRVIVSASERATVKVNGGDTYTVSGNNRTPLPMNLPAGGSKFEISVSNSKYNNTAYIAFSIYKDGEAMPEYKSSHEGWKGDLDEMPDAGAKPQVVEESNYRVWPIEPNWSDDITETLEWLTDVMSSESGAEQRRKVRLYPRRMMSAKFTEWRTTYRQLDMAIMSLGQDMIWVPLFWDKQALLDPAKKGDFDVYGTFTDRPDFYAGRAFLLKSATDYLKSEVLIIKEVYDHKIVVESEIKQDWPVGTILYPLSRGRINSVDSMTMPTNNAVETTVKFELTDRLMVDPKWHYCESNTSTGLNVLVGMDNNWDEEVTIEAARNIVTQDNSVSNAIMVDVGANSSTTQRVSTIAQGRSEYVKLLQLLYAMSGQFNLFQFPTKMQSIELARSINHEEGFIACKPMGYTAMGGDKQSVRQYIMILLRSGKRIFARVISTRIDRNVEYLVLEQAVGNIMDYDVVMICWCPISRLGSDSVDIQHVTDINGLSKAVLAIESFYNRRKV